MLNHFKAVFLLCLLLVVFIIFRDISLPTRLISSTRVSCISKSNNIKSMPSSNPAPEIQPTRTSKINKFPIQPTNTSFQTTALEPTLTPRFAIILNTESCLPVHLREYFGNSTSCDCHVFVLSFQTPCNDTALNHVQYIYRKVSFSPGRNIGLQEARKKKHDYLYFIFLDDDVHLTFSPYASLNIKKKAAPFKVFTDFLLDYEPAGATVEFGNIQSHTIQHWGSRCKRFRRPEFPVIVGFDAIFNAFHRDTVNLLFPLYNYDHISAWLSQVHLIFHVKVAFYGQIIRYPYIDAYNAAHRPYNRGLPLQNRKIIRTLIDDIKQRTPVHLRNHTVFKHLERYRDLREFLCMDPPTPRSKIVPYKTMFNG